MECIHQELREPPDHAPGSWPFGKERPTTDNHVSRTFKLLSICFSMLLCFETKASWLHVQAAAAHKKRVTNTRTSVLWVRHLQLTRPEKKKSPSTNKENTHKQNFQGIENAFVSWMNPFSYHVPLESTSDFTLFVSMSVPATFCNSNSRFQDALCSNSSYVSMRRVIRRGLSS